MAKRTRDESEPETEPGQTGFYQEYNEEPPVTQDLNPDVVTEDSELPEPAPAAAQRSTDDEEDDDRRRRPGRPPARPTPKPVSRGRR